VTSSTNSYTNIYYVSVPALMKIPGMDQKTAIALSNAGNQVQVLTQQVADLQIEIEEMQSRLFSTTTNQGG
jgi:hypothetical protein